MCRCGLWQEADRHVTFVSDQKIRTCKKPSLSELWFTPVNFSPLWTAIQQACWCCRSCFIRTSLGEIFLGFFLSVPQDYNFSPFPPLSACRLSFALSLAWVYLSLSVPIFISLCLHLSIALLIMMFSFRYALINITTFCWGKTPTIVPAIVHIDGSRSGCPTWLV